MDQKIKQRLVGITVIFALAVIFLPIILDGSGLRKNTLEVTIPPQPPVKFNPEFEQKIVDLHEKVENLPRLKPQFVDENSNPDGNKIAADNGQADKNKPDQASQPANRVDTRHEAAPKLVGGETWVLQVGSFRDRKKAFAQRDKLRKSNIAAVFVEKFNIDNQTIYRVRLGPFLDRDQSRIAFNKIKAKYDIDGLIMKYDK